jgi:hypothetical protein
MAISLAGGGAPEHADVEPLELETEYPEYRSFGVLPACGLYCRHANGITVDGLHVETREADARAAILLQDVSSSRLRNMALPARATAGERIVLRDCQDVVLDR